METDNTLIQRFSFVRTAILVLLGSIVVFAIFVGLIAGFSWLLSFFGLELTADTRYLIASMMVCTSILVVAAILHGGAMMSSLEEIRQEVAADYFAEDEDDDDSDLVDREEVAEMLRRVVDEQIHKSSKGWTVRSLETGEVLRESFGETGSGRPKKIQRPARRK